MGARTTSYVGPLWRCVEMALAGIHREFPCQIPLILEEPMSFQRPRDVTPAFYGCYDWHSAVHSHWLLVHWLAHAGKDEAGASEVRAAVAASLTEQNLAAEFQFLSAPHRAGFERPYGLAWLLQLAAELRRWNDSDARTWSARIEPLEQLAADRFRVWLPNLLSPVRTGEHSQTAFALGLVLDWGCEAADVSLLSQFRETALRFYASDRNLPIHSEPSGYDFLSPSLATADLMRRVFTPEMFASWLTAALPGFPSGTRLPPVPMPNGVEDGKLAHLVGLNFSRAWMLEGIAAGLPTDDRRRAGVSELARQHLDAGIPMLNCDEYSVTHWVGSFATYALAGCGLHELVSCDEKTLA